jgi:hypothetical protein
MPLPLPPMITTPMVLPYKHRPRSQASATRECSTNPTAGSILPSSAYVWCGSQPCQSRDASNAVIRDYFSEGELVRGRRRSPITTDAIKSARYDVRSPVPRRVPPSITTPTAPRFKHPPRSQASATRECSMNPTAVSILPSSVPTIP